MATAAAFERQIRVATAGLSPDAISARLAQVAKQSLAEVIASGEASEKYIRSVNGVIGAPEESVHVPGAIVYRFTYLAEAVLYALTFARARSPIASGDYRRAWKAFVNGTLWNGTMPIPLDAEVVITNDRPYARKIEVGSMRMSVPPRIVEDTRQSVQRQFPGSVKASVRFVSLSRAYILRRGRHAGEALTYPAIVLQAV